MRSNQRLELVFLAKGEATVAEIYEGLMGKPMPFDNRRGSQAISPYLSRFARSTGHAVLKAEAAYTYRLQYA